MKGGHHVLLSLCTAAVLLAPAAGTLPLPTLGAVLSGIFIGSLAPDADASDAAIFHGRRGRLGLLLPLFGYTIRYLIYYPISCIFRFIFGSQARPRHRGLLHSAIGVAFSSVLLSLYIRLALLVLGLPGDSILILFGAGFFGGCILHLLEDSCTPMGVAWWFPFRTTRLMGRIRTRSGDLRPTLFGITLALAAAFLLAGPVVPDLPRVPLAGLAAVMVGALWGIFLFVAGVHRGPDRLTSINP